jgi:hypothetical protein
MASTTPSDMNRAPCQPDLSPEAVAWQEIQHACYALGGAHGPHRRVAKQQLVAALERWQRFCVGRLDSRGAAELRRRAQAE